MSNVINVLYVLVAVIGAIYVAPFLIALIASGVIQLLCYQRSKNDPLTKE